MTGWRPLEIWRLLIKKGELVDTPKNLGTKLPVTLS